jgi:hypothetical protein
VFVFSLWFLGPWEQVAAVVARLCRLVRTEELSMALFTFADCTFA